MRGRPIGVCIDDMQVGPKEGLRRASQLGFHHVELGVVGSDIDPAQLSATGRRHLLKFAENLNLRIEALSADFGGARFADSATVDQRIQKTCRILELGAELGVPVVTAQVGRLSVGPPAHLIEALRQAAEHADLTGRVFAIQTVHDSPESFRALLDEIACQAVSTCYDPCALVVAGQDPIEGVSVLAGHIAICHTRDATMGSAENPGCETPIGEGQVEFDRFVAELEDASFGGVHILRCTTGGNVMSELQRAKEFLENLQDQVLQ